MLRNHFDCAVSAVSNRCLADVEPQALLGLLPQRPVRFSAGRRCRFAAVWPDLVERR